MSIAPPPVICGSFKTEPHPRDVRNEQGKLIGFGNCLFIDMGIIRQNPSWLSSRQINPRARNFIPLGSNVDRTVVIQQTFAQVHPSNVGLVPSIPSNPKPPLLFDSEGVHVSTRLPTPAIDQEDLPANSAISGIENPIQSPSNSDSHQRSPLPPPPSPSPFYRPNNSRPSAFTRITPSNPMESKQ